MPLKVYYLDDEIELCEIFSEYFELDGLDITTFIDATEAIQACNLNPPDLFIIDFRLTDTTGAKVALAIEENIPKILVTGELSLDDSSMFTQVILKPNHLLEIEKIINGYQL